MEVNFGAVTSGSADPAEDQHLLFGSFIAKAVRGRVELNQVPMRLI
jgi:hypothetical protein